ncbi:MAG TPA: iron-sulfur cluster assembly accessory protein [Vicinamibacterales bacterium]|nr:iron-sulfur cluster assembly accessory protein [Vicinamibacterales bacterium]
MITVTDNAATQIHKLIEKQHAEATLRQAQGDLEQTGKATGLRVGVKAGGCSGFEYVFAWEPAPRENDLIFEGPQGVRVWIDPRSHRLLDGTTLDYDTSLMSRGFVFQNPQAKSTCGCGTSFTV